MLPNFIFVVFSKETSSSSLCLSRSDRCALGERALFFSAWEMRVDRKSEGATSTPLNNNKKKNFDFAVEFCRINIFKAKLANRQAGRQRKAFLFSFSQTSETRKIYLLSARTRSRSLESERERERRKERE